MGVGLSVSVGDIFTNGILKTITRNGIFNSFRVQVTVEVVLGCMLSLQEASSGFP